MLYSILELIEDIATTIVGCAFLFRFWLQVTRIRPPAVIADRLFRLTDWLAKPLRRYIPAREGYDWCVVVAAIIVALFAGILDAWLVGYFTVRAIIFCMLVALLHWCIYGITALLIIEVLFSWINPYAPMAAFVRELNAPILRPIRKFVPVIAGIDFSTLIAFIILQMMSKLIASFVLGWLL